MSNWLKTMVLLVGLAALLIFVGGLTALVPMRRL